jgi:predicted nucleic-acid-binding protein
MLDTNVLLDWLLARDEARTGRIDKLLATAKDLQIPDIIIVELTFALEKFYEFPRDIVVENINKVIDEPVFNCNRVLFRRALVDYVDHPALSFVDCCLIHYAGLQNVAPVWTFDKKLVNQSGGRAKSLG